MGWRSWAVSGQGSSLLSATISLTPKGSWFVLIVTKVTKVTFVTMYYPFSGQMVC